MKNRLGDHLVYINFTFRSIVPLHHIITRTVASLPPLNSVHLAIILPFVDVYLWQLSLFIVSVWRPLLPLEEVYVLELCITAPTLRGSSSPPPTRRGLRPQRGLRRWDQ